MQTSGGIFHPLDLLDGNVGPSTGANESGISHISSLTVDLGTNYEPCRPPKAPSPPIVAPTPSPPPPPAPRTLTNPCEPSIPGGHDNINDDLIVSVNDILENAPLGTRYLVHDMLGQGTFGQVFKCSTQDDGGGVVAVKVIKNQAAYYHQARVEIGVLQFLNTRGDPTDECHIVRLHDFFLHKNHLCLVFELLDLNLFELLRHNRFRGLSLPLVRVFLSQILKALAVLNRSNIIHCDIKPENILLTDATSGEVKLIDFGSACFSSRTVYTYIQSRFYRSPEVVLGHQYTMSVDMWSLGCVAAELFLGLPLFPAACELDLMTRILEMIGPLPEYVLEQSKNTSKFFTSSDSNLHSTASYSGNGPQSTRLKNPEEFVDSTGQKAPIGKQYFQHKTLADIINAYPFRQGLNDTEIQQERARRESFTDFLFGLLDVDPITRWTPLQALRHPFITGNAFTGPFQPIPEGIHTGKSSIVSVQVGIPMSIPQPRVHVHTTTTPAMAATPTSTSAALDSIAAAVVASSPQMHAQAHAAAMAAVQRQMNMHQQQQQHAQSIPIQNDITAGGGGGRSTSSSSPYIAAHSLQRIMDPPLATHSSGLLSTRPSSESGGGYGYGGESQWRAGSYSAGQGQGQGHSSSSLLPMSFFSPPSRSFGVHLQSMAPDQLPPPSFDPGYSNSPHRIMPLMHLPAGREQPDESPIPFQPSSVSTYRSTLAAAAAAAGAADVGGGGAADVGGGGALGNYSNPAMHTIARQQQYQQYNTSIAARKEPLQRTAGFVVPTNANTSSGGELGEAMSIPIEDNNQTPLAPAPVEGISREDTSNDEGASPPDKQQQNLNNEDSDLPNPDAADWDPLWTDDVLTEEESFDHGQRSTGKNILQSGGIPAGEGAMPSTANYFVPPPPPTISPKDSSLALAAQHLTQIQPLNPVSGVSASWPIGASGVDTTRNTGFMNLISTAAAAGGPTGQQQQPCSPRSPHGSLMEGISHAENMMWSPPRTAVATILKNLPDAATTTQQQQQQLHQVPPPAAAQSEPLQRLHGFVVSSDRAENEEKEQRTDDE